MTFEELDEKFAITDTAKTLEATPAVIEQYESEAVEAQIKLEALRAELSVADGVHEEAVQEALLVWEDSPAAKKTDRDRRILDRGVYLRNHHGVVIAKKRADALRAELRTKEAVVERIKVNVRRYNNALRARLQAVALHTEIIRLYGGERHD